MIDPENVKGIIPPIVTPVDDNENVDPEGLARIINYVIDGGVHGVFVLGSNGEFFGLDDANQQLAIELTLEYTRGRVPVYAGTGAITTQACIRFASLAKSLGADAMTALLPMYIQPSEEELYNHFRAIAKSTPLPVILYNNPGRTTNNISIGLLKKLAEIDNIVGIKNTTNDFAQTVRFLHETEDNSQFNVLSGNDYMIYATMAHGGTGAVAGTANVAPALAVELYNRFVSGDHEGAIAVQNRLVPLRNAYGLGSFPVVMKDCLNLMGVQVGKPIKPLDPVAEDRLGTLKEILSDLDLI